MTIKKNSKVVLMILNQAFLPDVRVEQEVNSLKKHGYRVIVVASNKGIDHSDFEILRVSKEKSLNSLSHSFLRVSPKLKNEITSKLKKLGVEKIDVVHVHDLPWANLGLALSKHYDAKFIVDFHENYPGWVKDKRKKISFNRNLIRFLKSIFNLVFRYNSSPFKNWISYNYKTRKVYERYEKKIIEESDVFISVVEEGLTRFKDNSNFGKGIVISNTKSSLDWEFKELPPINGKIIISYVGTVQHLRGLDTAIKAMKYVNQEDFKLQIVGIKHGSKIHQEYLELIEKNNISNVELINFITDEDKAFEFIFNSHIGIVPHRSTELTQTTIPHKLFMYMATGRPVLVSDVKPLKRVVEDAGNGMVFKAEDPQSFALQLNKMKSKSILDEFSLNGRKSIENKYDWKFDEKKLIKAYKNLIT